MPNDSNFRTVEMADLTRMGWRRRQMAFVVALIGLATFVSPMVSTDSAILGRTRWSPLQIISALHAGTLPIAHRMPRELAAYLGVDFLIGIGVVYLLLGLVTAAILFLPSTRFIGSTSATGAAWVWGEARFRYQDLQDAIYGAPSSFISGQQVHAGTICLILLGVLLLLIWIAATRALD